MSGRGARTSVPVEPIPLAVGAQMPAAVVGPLTRTDLVRYAGASGDFNPVHHDEEFAAAAGFPSVFGIGMLTAGILGSRLAAWVGPDSIRSYSVRFTSQTWPGDVLTYDGVVTAITPGDEGPTATIELEAVNQKGERVATGSATALVANPS